MESPPSNRDQLIEQNLSYVRALAIKIRNLLGTSASLDELIAYGRLGLVEAAENFDPRRRVAFKTFSYYRIRGAIFDGLREMGYFSRRSSKSKRFEPHADEAMKNALDAQGVAGAPTVEDEIASAEAIIDTLIPVYLLSLEDEQVPEVIDERAFSEAEAERRDLLRVVRLTMRELPERERQLLEAVYFKNAAQKDLAALWGVDKSWVARLHKRAIELLSDALRARGLLAPPT
jgi:RNA polymerase sigma factor for flagellar operon FliA